jgi:hypothetical protein
MGKLSPGFITGGGQELALEQGQEGVGRSRGLLKGWNWS